MKKTKLAVAGLLGLSLFGAQSAFATTGVYDGPGTAKTVASGDIYTGYIDSASDSDWFVITQSGSGFYPRLICPPNIDLDAQVIWIGPSGYVSNTIISNAGAGGMENLGGYQQSPGQLFYIRVFPHSSNDVSTTSAYTLLVQ